MSNEKQLTNKEEKKNTESYELTHDKPVFVPATDIYEKGENIYVVCDIPGVAENDVDIQLENDVLTITAHQESGDYKNYEIINLGYGTGIYQRSFNLTDGIDRDKIKAKLNNGVLKIELPKAESLKPKKISIST